MKNTADIRKTLFVATAALALGTAFAADTLEIGWAEADITPPLTKRVPLDGQLHRHTTESARACRSHA